MGDATRETRAVYKKADAAWARFSCPGTAECCQLATTKREPWLWPSEWAVLTFGRALPPPRADGGCPFLDAAGKRCTAYADRPLGCRTFFCHRIQGPSKQPVLEMDALMTRMERLNLDDDETAQPKPLTAWYESERNPT
jgi:Fe-S-cluster containining protein